MISSVDPAQVGASLMTQSDATPLASTNSTVTTQVEPFKLLSQTTTVSSPSSFTETLNKLMVMLESLMASLATLFGKNAGVDTNRDLGGVGEPSQGNQGNFDFLRQVDQEPVTIIPVSKDKSNGSTTDTGKTSNEKSPPVSADAPTKKPTRTKKRSRKSNAAGTTLPKSNGEFLWKPASDKNGKLAILLPKGLTGKAKGVEVLSPDGTSVLAKGKYAGNGNGDREHFRFNKPGGEFPDGAIVVITMKDGTKQQVIIKETSDRTTR